MSKSPKVRVPRSKGPKDQDISMSNSNTSLTLKKVHLVKLSIFFFLSYWVSTNIIPTLNKGSNIKTIPVVPTFVKLKSKSKLKVQPSYLLQLLLFPPLVYPYSTGQELKSSET